MSLRKPSQVSVWNSSASKLEGSTQGGSEVLGPPREARSRCCEPIALSNVCDRLRCHLPEKRGLRMRIHARRQPPPAGLGAREAEHVLVAAKLLIEGFDGRPFSAVLRVLRASAVNLYPNPCALNSAG